MFAIGSFPLSAPFRQWRRRAVLVVSAVALLTCADVATAVERLSAGDRHAIEQTIRMQIDAFEHDDADRAFGFAAPDIQRFFGSSDRFIDMVREHYEPVYRPASMRFLRVELVDGDWTQAAQITDGQGKVWRALFTMRRQDKGWRVGGCQLVETSAIET